MTRSGWIRRGIDKVELLSAARRCARCARAIPPRSGLEIEVQQAIPELTAGILIRDRMGNDVFGTNPFHHGAPRRNLGAGERLAVEFAFEANAARHRLLQPHHRAARERDSRRRQLRLVGSRPRVSRWFPATARSRSAYAAFPSPSPGSSARRNRPDRP
jgi:hypothetical protein